MNLRPLLRSPIAALSGLTALAAWPIVRTGYPSTGDGLNHLYRLVEFDHLLRGGVWFPRWATDLGYGYGYPLFNFYPPLTYYLGALVHALGRGYADSLRMIYVLALALAVTGAYVLARDRWGSGGGLIASAAYGLAPYLYFNVFARGALPETWALGLLPWALWAYVRLAQRPSAARFLAATLGCAALWLSHILSALLAAPLLFLFAFLSALPLSTPFDSDARPPIVRRLSYVTLCFVISTLVAAYFLLPALLETGAVQIHQLTTPGDLDFRNHFLALGQLLAWPQRFDPRLVFVPVPPSLNLAALGVAALALMVAGLTGAVIRKSSNRGAHLLLERLGAWELGLSILSLVLAALTLPVTLFLWERFPFASVLQFPWRLVGPLSLLLALLAASLAPRLEFLSSAQAPHSRSTRRTSLPALAHWSPALALAALFFSSLTWTFAPRSQTPLAPGVRDLAAYEAAGQLGTTSAGEFLPVAVHLLPPADSLRAQYAARPVIDRLGPLPAGVAVVSQSANLTSATATVEASAPVEVAFNVFYFPGWSATVDGRPASISASSPHGLITVPIDAGRHTLSIRFGPTPLRAAATGLSWVGVLALGVITIRLRAAPVPAPEPNTPPRSESGPASLAVRHGSFLVTALALLLVRSMWIDGRDTVFRGSRFDGASVSSVGRALDVNFEDQLVLVGLDLPRTKVTADEPFDLTLYWRAQNPPRADYSTSIQVLDSMGNLFGQSDSQHPGRVPTSRWRLGQYAADQHRLALLPATPPGEYRLLASVYRFDADSASEGALPALNVLNENHLPEGQAFALGLLTVRRAARPPARLDAAEARDLRLGPLTLVGHTLGTRSPSAGDDLRFTLFWRANEGNLPDLRLLLEIAALDGSVILAEEGDPARADYPTSAWASGEVVRAPLKLRLPAAAPAGAAELRASLLSRAGERLAGPVPLAALDLRVPRRSYAVPEMAHPRGDVLGGLVKLLGYDLAPDGLTLYWQALAPMDTSYTVFVHVLDGEGRLLAQMDARPMNGARPTTGWLPGEVITDAYPLIVGGAPSLQVGMYEAESGERLGTVRLIP